MLNNHNTLFANIPVQGLFGELHKEKGFSMEGMQGYGRTFRYPIWMPSCTRKDFLQEISSTFYGNLDATLKYLLYQRLEEFKYDEHTPFPFTINGDEVFGNKLTLTLSPDESHLASFTDGEKAPEYSVCQLDVEDDITFDIDLDKVSLTILANPPSL
ncbi:hypothetical protein D3C74_49390 [compost metagenome]